MTQRKKPSGHPARRDPDVDKLYRTMRSTVELVRDLQGRLSSEQHLYLKASAAGMMFAYAALTGLPSPIEVLADDGQEMTHGADDHTGHRPLPQRPGEGAGGG